MLHAFDPKTIQRMNRRKVSLKSGYPKINVTRATNATRVRPEDYSTDVMTSLSKPTKGKFEVGIIDFKS